MQYTQMYPPFQSNPQRLHEYPQINRPYIPQGIPSLHAYRSRHGYSTSSYLNEYHPHERGYYSNESSYPQHSQYSSYLPPLLPPLSTRPHHSSTPPSTSGRRVRIKTERRREQCRANQARYRDKQRSFALELELNVIQLRKQVATLTEQHQSKAVAKNRALNMNNVTKFFQLFQHGLAVDRTVEGRIEGTTYEDQMVFLNKWMIEDVNFLYQSSREKFVEEWKRYTTYHEDLQLQLGMVDVLYVSEKWTKIHTQSTLRGGITSTTLHHVFPQLVEQDETHVKGKLLGERVEYPLTMIFTMDQSGQVVSVDINIDFISGLYTLLQDMEIVALILEGAKIKDSFHLGEIVEDMEEEAGEVEKSRLSRHNLQFIISNTNERNQL